MEKSPRIVRWQHALLGSRKHQIKRLARSSKTKYFLCKCIHHQSSTSYLKQVMSGIHLSFTNGSWTRSLNLLLGCLVGWHTEGLLRSCPWSALSSGKHNLSLEEQSLTDRRLGDRHLENILLDINSGDVVHVDFNCLFEKVYTLLSFSKRSSTILKTF